MLFSFFNLKFSSYEKLVTTLQFDLTRFYGVIICNSVLSNEQRARSNEQRTKTNKQRAKTNEQRAKNNKKRAKSSNQRAKTNQQRATSEKFHLMHIATVTR